MSESDYTDSKANERNKPFRQLAAKLADKHGVEVTHTQLYALLASYKRRPRAYAVRLLYISDEAGSTDQIAATLAHKYALESQAEEQ